MKYIALQTNSIIFAIRSDFTEMPAEELAGKKYLFIAGGVGTAPVYPQVKWLHERGVAVDVIIGAKTKDLVIYKEEMEAVCDNLGDAVTGAATVILAMGAGRKAAAAIHKYIQG